MVSRNLEAVLTLNKKISITPSRMIYKIIKILFFVFPAFFLFGCGTPPENPNVILLCSLKKQNEKYIFLLEKVLFDSSNLDLKFRIGMDVSGHGLKYRGEHEHRISDMYICFFSISEKAQSEVKKVQFVKSLSVVNGVIPALNNESLIDFEKSLDSKAIKMRGSTN